MKMNSLAVKLWLALFSFFIPNVLGSNICRESCDVEFKTLGCYKDRRHDRALPYYIYNERDPSINNYGNRSIDWVNWNVYYPGFACRCARKAYELGYDLFGLQFYGECWAGHSHLHDYKKHGGSNDGCIEDDFLPCNGYTRYCMGTPWHNMVYQIADTSCPEVPFEKVGCFRDNHIPSARPLPDYLFNDRDPSIDNFSGHRIDWINWDVYVPEFACRCAAAAKAKNHTFFGMQFYGECWSGADGHLTFDRDGTSKSCVDPCYKPCTKQSQFCSGKNFANYVYKIKDGSCEVDIKPKGCYKEDANDLAMQVIFYNEGDPRKPNFGGSLLPASSADFAAEFPNFVCRCAREAKINGWEYFGIREPGLCVRSSPTITNYDKHGIASAHKCKCPCGSDSLCSGLDTAANFVYQITLSGFEESSDTNQDEPDEYAFPRLSPRIIQQGQKHP